MPPRPADRAGRNGGGAKGAAGQKAQRRASRFAEASVRTAVVRFTRVKVSGLKAADMNGLSDPYLRFHAVPHRDYLARTELVSKIKKKKLDAEWKNNEIPTLSTILRNNEQLRQLVIAISIWDHDVSSQDDPLGDILVPVGNFMPVDANPTECSDVPPQRFNKRITLHGQQAAGGKELGYLSGSISVTWQWDTDEDADDAKDECSVQ